MLGYRLRGSTQEEIYDAANDMFMEQSERSATEIAAACERSNKTIESLLAALDRLFHRCAKLQSEREKEPVRYVHLFALKSCLLTGDYQIQINLFDTNSYLDACYLYELWYPEIFMKHYREDLAYFQEENRLIQFDDYKFQDIAMRYYDLYLTLIGQFVIKEIHRATELPSYSEMEKHSDIQFIYGGYMDHGIQVYPPPEVII